MLAAISFVDNEKTFYATRR